MTGKVENTEDLKNIGQILSLPCSKLEDHPLHFAFFAPSHLEELLSSIPKIRSFRTDCGLPLRRG